MYAAITEQRSKVLQENLFNFDIGLVDSYSKLNCSINLHEKSFRYYKCKKDILLAFDPIIILKKLAFKKIYELAFKNKQAQDTIFIPEQLYKGNQNIIPAFLKRLKQQKVESYINLHVTNQKPLRQKSEKMIQSLVRVIINVRYHCFKMMKDLLKRSRFRHEINDPNESKIRFAGRRRKEQFGTPQTRNHRSLNVAYTRINLHSKHSLQKATIKKYPDVSIKFMQQRSSKKMYKFESFDRTLSKN